MLWVKSFHIIFMVCWFACLFYLPRLFVNNAMATNPDTKSLLTVMQRKLFRFSLPWAFLTVIFGVWLVVGDGRGYQYFINAGWFQLKMLLVFGLIIYHIMCGRMVKLFEDNANQRGHVFYRWFNELPVIVLVGAVLLVMLKPF